MSRQQALHVVAAALEDEAGRILVTQRPAGKRQAGRWEFPGGKVEDGEPVLAALERELREELGVELVDSEPLIKLHHDYASFSVFLDVHRVRSWRGEIRALESQAMQWCFPDALHAVDILEADLPIIHALQLPARIVITPPVHDRSSWLQELQATLSTTEADPFILQLRQPQLQVDNYLKLASEVLAMAKGFGVDVMLNGRMTLLESLPDAAGVHLPSRCLEDSQAGEGRLLPAGKWLSAAVHDQQHLERALNLSADFLLLSPVNETASHPGRSPLGWQEFEQLAGSAGIPCYALGGMQPGDIEKVRQHGGQGVAGISSFWKRQS